MKTETKADLALGSFKAKWYKKTINQMILISKITHNLQHIKQMK